MFPVNEKPPIDWPSVEVAGQKLIVRWTFYAQWLLSKRKVDASSLNPRDAAGQLIKNPELVANMVEAWGTAVAENFRDRGVAPPDAEYWARIFSSEPETKWGECVAAFWLAVTKVRPAAAPPAPQEPATTGTTLN